MENPQNEQEQKAVDTVEAEPEPPKPESKPVVEEKEKQPRKKRRNRRHGNKNKGQDQGQGNGKDSPNKEGAASKRVYSENTVTEKNLIVNYLPQDFSDRALYNLFIPFGPLESVKIMKDLQTGYSYGFGFVNFKKEKDAIEARNALNKTQIGNKRLKVSYARAPSDDIKDTNLYITNLPRDYTEDDLQELFAPYGDIVQRNLLRDKLTNLPRGVAFVRYDKRDQACAAILALNNVQIMGSMEPIRVRLAEDHGKQKAAYVAGFQAGLNQRVACFSSSGQPQFAVPYPASPHPPYRERQSRPPPYYPVPQRPSTASTTDRRRCHF